MACGWVQGRVFFLGACCSTARTRIVGYGGAWWDAYKFAVHIRPYPTHLSVGDRKQGLDAVAGGLERAQVARARRGLRLLKRRDHRVVHLARFGRALHCIAGLREVRGRRGQHRRRARAPKAHRRPPPQHSCTQHQKHIAAARLGHGAGLHGPQRMCAHHKKRKAHKHKPRASDRVQVCIVPKSCARLVETVQGEPEKGWKGRGQGEWRAAGGADCAA